MRLVRHFSPFDTASRESAHDWTPPVDIFEKGDDLIVRVELPGVDKDDIHVAVEDQVLVIEGERKRDDRIKDQNAYLLERNCGSFARRFRLSDAVDASRIGAAYRNGVLELTLPKAEAAKPRKIEIQAA